MKIRRLGWILGLLGVISLPAGAQQAPKQEAAPPAKTPALKKEKDRTAKDFDLPRGSLLRAEIIEWNPRPIEVTAGLTPSIMQRLLLAEIAGQRTDYNTAAEEYASAAKETNDLRVVRRATEVAMYAKRFDLAEVSAKQWRTLDPQSERALQLQIAALVNSGNLAEVQAPLAQYLSSAKDNLNEVFMQLPRLFAGHANRQAVFKLMQALAVPYPNLPEASFAVGAAGLQTGMTDLAVVRDSLAAAEHALVLRPAWERAIILKSQILAKTSPERSLKTLRDFLDSHPKANDVRVQFAMSLFEQNQLAASRDEFSKLLTADPNSHDTRFRVALVSLQMGDAKFAREQLERLIKTDYRDLETVRYYLGHAYEAEERYADAISQYKLITDGTQYFPAQLRLAYAMAKLNKLPEARVHLQKVRASDENQRIRLAQTEAQLLRDAEQNDAAYEYLATAVTLYPNAADLHYDLAMVAEKLDRVDVAEKGLRRVIELAPDNAHAYNALGYTFADRKVRLDEALKLIEKAHQLSPDDAFILDSLGWIHYRLGHLDRSVEILRRAFQERPDPEIAAHLGEVLWASGDREGARRIWDTQLKKNPGHTLLRETVRRLSALDR